jgi:hypothetical protein
MQAIYKPDGTITQVYDEALHRHDSLLTIDLTAEQAENISLYRVNPNDMALYLTPTCDKKYQKVIDNVIIEMTQEEKDFVDVPGKYKKMVDDVLVEMSEEEKLITEKNIRQTNNKSACDNHILSFYSGKIQDSFNAGVYSEAATIVYKDFLVVCIAEENRVFDLIEATTTIEELNAVESPTWPEV